MLLLVDLMLNEIFIMICNQTTIFVWRPCPINMCTLVINLPVVFFYSASYSGVVPQRKSPSHRILLDSTL